MRLNVTRVLRSPRFRSTKTVTRRAQSVDSHGIGIITETTITISAVVVAGTTQPFVQMPEAEHAKNDITVYTQTRLLDPTTGFLPDIVSHQGNKYVVTKLYDWAEWGEGWYAAECSLQDLINA